MWQLNCSVFEQSKSMLIPCSGFPCNKVFLCRYLISRALVTCLYHSENQTRDLKTFNCKGTSFALYLDFLRVIMLSYQKNKPSFWRKNGAYNSVPMEMRELVFHSYSLSLWFSISFHFATQTLCVFYQNSALNKIKIHNDCFRSS